MTDGAGQNAKGTSRTKCGKSATIMEGAAKSRGREKK